jgi:hypothetical protein
MGFDSSKSSTVRPIRLPEGVSAEELCVPVTCEVKWQRRDEGSPAQGTISAQEGVLGCEADDD